MKRIRWTQRALRNLRHAHSFLAAENPEAASRAVRKIQADIRILETLPEIGRPITHLKYSAREWSIQFGSGAYFIRYRIITEEVVLLAIRHSKQNDFHP